MVLRKPFKSVGYPENQGFPETRDLLDLGAPANPFFPETWDLLDFGVPENQGSPEIRKSGGCQGPF